jgi:hypothetical protein
MSHFFSTPASPWRNLHNRVTIPCEGKRNKQATGTDCQALDFVKRGLSQFRSRWPRIVDLHRSSNRAKLLCRRLPLAKCSSHEKNDRLGIQKTHFLVQASGFTGFYGLYTEIRLSRLAARQKIFPTGMRRRSSKIVIVPVRGSLWLVSTQRCFCRSLLRIRHYVY